MTKFQLYLELYCYFFNGLYTVFYYCVCFILCVCLYSVLQTNIQLFMHHYCILTKTTNAHFSVDSLTLMHI